MQWILNRSDLGFQMTRNFSGNILIMGGDSFNDISLDLCEMILNYSPKCHIYYFNISKVNIKHKIWSFSNIRYIYCDLYHRNGFLNSINRLNRRNFYNYRSKLITFDIFINLTQFTQIHSEDKFLCVVPFQTIFNKCIINPMKAMKYSLNVESVYIINMSVNCKLNYNINDKVRPYNKIDQLICGNCINQFHDSLSSEREGKCLLILVSPNLLLDQDTIDKINLRIMECLKLGCNGEYNFLKSINLHYVVEQTKRILYGWT